MKTWRTRKISETEYHVVEYRFVGEPEYILAKCNGPVPAGEIAAAMRFMQSLNNFESRIHSSLSNLKESFSRVQLDLRDATDGQFDELKEK